MKKLILVLAFTVAIFAVLLPFASRTPDGVQKLTADSGSQQQPVWHGLMTDYSIASGNPYVSTLVAGLLGTGIVLMGTFVLGSVASQKKPDELGEST